MEETRTISSKNMYIDPSLYGRDAKIAADAMKDFQSSISELVADGVPGICGLELSRRILDADIPGSLELTACNSDSE